MDYQTPNSQKDPQSGQVSKSTDDSGKATDQDYAQLKQELEQTQGKLQEMVKISQRALADLQNFKRRTEEEKSSFTAFANAALIGEFIPVINNIHRILGHEPKDAEWAKGVEPTLKQFIQTLEKAGIKSIPTTGQKFDPRLHEALLMAPGEKDIILEELEKGYTLGEKVLKPARVKVGNGQM